MIQAKDVTKSYNGTQVLRGISLDVADGDFTVVLGASGSGKSTLLNVLSGLERADGGSVDYDGIRLNALNDKQLTAFRKREVAFIFQQYYLLPHLSVKNNVKLSAALAQNGDYESILAAVGLSDKANANPSTLSGGEQQRVCIARALAKQPKTLLLDEPTGALDEKTGREILDYIIRLQQERRFTMIMVTHNRNIAETANTVITMNSGRIVGLSRNDAPKSAFDIGW